MSKVRADLRNLATGVDLALTAMHDGEKKEFFLIVVDHQGDSVTLNTVGNVTNPTNVQLVGKHLIDMAEAQAKQEPSLDPFDDLEVRGHA